MAVMAFAVLSVAQDVYSVGYYMNNSYKVPAVYKNSTKLYDFVNAGYDYEGTDVIRFNGDTYWSFNCTTGSQWASVFKNGTRYLDPSISSSGNLKINALTHGSSYVFAVGCTPSGSSKQATVWRGSETTPMATISGNTEALCADFDLQNGYLYYGGYQQYEGGSYEGKVWKEFGTEVYSVSDGYIRGICVYEGKVWYIATMGGGTTTKVYYNNTLQWTISDCWGRDIYVDAGDVYVVGSTSYDNEDIKVWKNGNLLYTKSGTASYGVGANSAGVFYVGASSGAGKIWKNSSVLYSPSSCTKLFGMCVEDPACSDDIFSLPFTDGFENGNTHWPCWTVNNSGTQNGTDWYPGWDRFGRCSMGGPYTYAYSGDYCVMHGWSSSTHTDWLISPRLFLQPGRDQTTLTFKCYRASSSSPSLWISTSGTSSSNFSEITSVNWGSTGSWQTVTVNLNAYQGEAVYIGFKMTSTPTGSSCSIDDFSVTESWSICSPESVPYSFSFNNWNPQNTCWYIWDSDMSGGKKCWQYNSSENCAWHPWGQSGVAQRGFLCSPRITLQSGHDYVLKFKSKNASSGSGMHNQIWLKTDETTTPVPGSYTTQIWNDTQFPTTWTEVEVPLTAYAGHNVTLNFAYYGTYAHAWYIKDVRVEESIAQYTITANSNNSSWGTVSGGGTYNSGATCTLTATAASGYHFESWKKNGSVVSTSATYSFTVTENATYTAYFAVTPVTYYTITTNVSPAGAGTVSGGGTYPEGASVTLTATSNNGYTFDHWQDGNTQNPRTITVTSNATYTATFTQDNYQITTAANPPAGGTVTGGGSYHYGDTPTLTATANSGYEFAGWQDGSTTNPRQITVTGNATYTATFSEVGTTYYTVTASVSPSEAGEVQGTGTYEEGSVIQLTAVPNPGYTFDHWNDGVTANPRSVTVTGNLSFTAYFTHNFYTITVNANPSNAGSVTGGGSYYYGDYATLTATAYSGYEFVGWSDGSSQNPHQVLVTGNATYTATFSVAGGTYYTVSTYVSPTGAGTVSGAGTYPAGASVTLTATANSGYVFDHWNDGSTSNPRTITVNNNMSFTAYFNTNEYTITTNVAPAGSGTVTGGGTYPYGASVTLTATPNTGYEFLQWSDGNLQNPRTITVTGNASYTALFSNGTGTMYTLTVTSGNVLLGQVFGGGVYPAGSEVEISATPNSYARFVKWDDGNTENPRTVVVNSDMEFVAEFVATQNFTITVESADPTRGQAFGGGTYQEGREVDIAAVAFSGYMFEKWQDGNTQNPRTITVTENATYTAYFVESSTVTYTVTLTSNPEQGTVSGGGTYISGTQATIQAFPNPGYVFTQWSDENTDNPRTFTVTSDVTLVAFFGTGVGENDEPTLMVYPNPAKESIRIIGIEANSQIEIYNSLGELVKVMSVSADQEIGIRDLASGLYLVRCGNVTLRFVKEQ